MSAPYLGDFPADQPINFMWGSNDADGASITRAADGTISVYKDNSDGSSYDQTQVTTGVTDDEDMDSLTGVHSCCITTTDPWYETGHDYAVVLSAATIDGQTVNAVLAMFSIQNRYMRGTDSAALASVLGALADAAADGDPISADTLMQYTKQLVNVLVGSAGIVAFPSEAAPDNGVSLAEVLRAVHADVTGLNGNAMRGTDGANTTTPLDAAGVRTAVGLASANLDTQLSGLLGYVDCLPATLDGSTFTNLPAVTTDSASREASKATGFSTHTAADVVTALGTGSTLTACLTATGFSTLDAAGVRTAIGMASDNLDTQLSGLLGYVDCLPATLDGSTFTSLPDVTTDAASREASKATGFSTHDAAAVKTAMEADGSKLDHLWEMTEDDAGTRRLTENALEQAPDTTAGLTLDAAYDAAKTAAQPGADGDTLKTLSDQIDGPVSANVKQINDNAFAAKVLANKCYAMIDDTVVVVADSDTDAGRGTNLAAAYAAAKALTPGGSAISATNRATVLLPPGRYKLAATLVLDTSGVDLFALVPEMGGDRVHTDLDISQGPVDLASYRPPRTEVYCDTENVTAVEQSAEDVRLKGFAIAHIGATNATGHALYVSAVDNEPSIYEEMYFWNREAFGDGEPTSFYKHVKGAWRRCIANAYAWRVGNVDNDGEFSPTMYDCQAGAYSYGGDYGTYGSQTATGCYLVRCRSVGKFQVGETTYPSGFGSFCGCGSWAIPIDSTCYFEDCVSGPASFGIGQTNAGTFVRCRAGYHSFGATNNPSYPGEFSGYAEDCYAGTASFGGRQIGVGDNGKLTGTLVRCVCQDGVGYGLPWRCEGATIEGCLLEIGYADQGCIALLDSATRITNSTLLAVEGGTGVPINADSALNVCAAGNRYNNLDNNATGLGANVTNLGIAEGQTDAASRSAIADAVHDEATTDHTTAGSFGKLMVDVKTDTGNLVTRITTTLFSGITSLAEWLGLLANKQAGNATARTELRATGAGGGTFDETSDSLEASKDLLGAQELAIYNRLGAPAGASMSVDIAAIPTAEETADQVWDEATADHSGVGSTGKAVADAAVGASPSAVADAVWDEAIADHVAAGSTGEALSDVSEPASASAIADHVAAGSTGEALSDVIDDTGTSGVVLASSEDVYHADIFLTRDDINNQDEYTVQWYKNGTPVIAGITSPTLQVVKRADGTNLIGATAMTQIGATGAYKLDSSSRLTVGEAAIAVTAATIDGGNRLWRKPVGRDV